jgi:hypothetical protein
MTDVLETEVLSAVAYEELLCETGGKKKSVLK